MEQYVRCVLNRHALNQLTRGEEYKVLRIVGEMVYIIDDNGDEDWFHEGRFSTPYTKPTEPTANWYDEVHIMD